MVSDNKKPPYIEELALGNDNFKYDHLLPHANSVVWDWLVGHYCRDKRVLDLGCGGAPEFDQLWKEGKLLHKKVQEAAREAVGLDLDGPTVEQMCRLGFHVVCDNAENPVNLNGAGVFDVIVAGDIIEHVNNPGAMLASMKSRLAPNGVFVISTPNPFRWYNPVFATIRHEFNHPHHTAWFSPLTLTTLAGRHGYRVMCWHVMDKVTAPIDSEDSIGKKLGKVLFRSTDAFLRRIIFRRNEWLADTIVAVLTHG